MAVVRPLQDARTKRLLLYGAMVVAGAIMVSTVIAPLPTAVAQLVAALSFGVMSGLWLGHLVHSL